MAGFSKQSTRTPKDSPFDGRGFHRRFTWRLLPRRKSNLFIGHFFLTQWNECFNVFAVHDKLNGFIYIKKNNRNLENLLEIKYLPLLHEFTTTNVLAVDSETRAEIVHLSEELKRYFPDTGNAKVGWVRNQLVVMNESINSSLCIKQPEWLFEMFTDKTLQVDLKRMSLIDFGLLGS